MLRASEDRLSSHLFFVAQYSWMVAQAIGWKGDFGLLLMAALNHDNDELATGDIVVTAKRHIVDKAALDRYSRKAVRDMVGVQVANAWLSAHQPGIREIIKVGDALDALFYACSELMRGNATMEARLPSLKRGLAAAWDNLPASKAVKKQAWPMVAASVSRHLTPAEYDIEGAIP